MHAHDAPSNASPALPDLGKLENDVSLLDEQPESKLVGVPMTAPLDTIEPIAEAEAFAQTQLVTDQPAIEVNPYEKALEEAKPTLDSETQARHKPLDLPNQTLQDISIESVESIEAPIDEAGVSLARLDNADPASSDNVAADVTSDTNAPQLSNPDIDHNSNVTPMTQLDNILQVINSSSDEDEARSPLLDDVPSTAEPELDASDAVRRVTTPCHTLPLITSPGSPIPSSEHWA